MRKSFSFKTFIMLLSLLIYGGMAVAQVGLNDESVITTLVFRDRSDQFISGKEFRVLNSDSSVLVQGVTDEKGEFVQKLFKGHSYTVKFHEAGMEWIFDIAVSKDPATAYARSVCKLDVDKGEVGSLMAADKQCHLRLILLDSAGQRLDSLKIRSLDLNGTKVGEAYSNSNGEVDLILTRNQVCTVQASFHKALLEGKLEVPNSEKAILEIKLEKFRR